MVFQNFGRHSGHDRIIGNIFYHHSSSSYYCVVSNILLIDYFCPSPTIYIITYHYFS